MADFDHGGIDVSERVASMGRTMRMAAEKALTRNPALDRAAIDDYIDAYQRAYPDYIADITAREAAPPLLNGRADRPLLRTEEAMIERKFHQRVHDEIIARHGAKGQQVWEGMAQALQPPGIIEGATKLFYDSDKNGMQFGGIVGGLLGGLMGASLFGGVGGGWLGWLAIALSALLGAWGGDKLVDWMDKKDGRNEAARIRQPEKTPQPDLSPRMAPAQQKMYDEALANMKPELTSRKALQDTPLPFEVQNTAVITLKTHVAGQAIPHLVLEGTVDNDALKITKSTVNGVRMERYEGRVIPGLFDNKGAIDPDKLEDIKREHALFISLRAATPQVKATDRQGAEVEGAPAHGVTAPRPPAENIAKNQQPAAQPR